MKRIWVTGMGGVCAVGRSVAEMETAFFGSAREPVQSPFAAFGVDAPVFAVGDVDVAEGESRTVALARMAMDEAIRERGASSPHLNCEDEASRSRAGICIGTTVASQINDIPFYERLRRTGAVDRAAVARYRNGNVAEALARILAEQTPALRAPPFKRGLHSPVATPEPLNPLTPSPRLTVCNACSSGADAVGVARSWLHAGLCDAAIAGGADELSRLAVCGFHALGVYSAERCRPFDRDRKGLNLGEGAGILILETEEHAMARGAAPLCELVGYGAANDAHHLTAPHPDGTGLASAISIALADAKVSPRDVAFVNAHGTATLDNDRVEGKALASIFGSGTPVVSTKGWTGHTLGAAGALEAVFTIMGLRAQRIPGTAGLIERDADIPVRVSAEAQEVSGEYAVSTSLAFGGCNAALVFRRIP